MLLKPYKINIKTGGRHIAVLHEETAHKLDLHVGDRLRLKSDRTEIIAALDITSNHFPKKRIGLFKETFDHLNLEPDDMISLIAAEKPKSLLYIREKLDGKRLMPKEINAIIKDIVHDELTDVELTYFVAGCYAYGLNDDETTALTRAIVRNGKRLEFKDKIVADKHCIGGVPGNRVTPIVVPIMVAAGVKMPKTSSRAITSPAGTADAIETVANVTINAHRLKEIADKIGGFMVWGGGVDLAAADDRMIRIRNPVSLDPEGMLLASIMAKKHSVSATHVLIDIPVGKTVKIKDAKRAQHLKKRFIKIGKMLGMKVAVIITDGSQPIGNGIGPFLEMEDVMKVLKNDLDAPEDLREKALLEAKVLLELTRKAKKGRGYQMAENLLDSGKAWKTFQKIIEAQGKKRFPKPAKFQGKILAAKNGKVTEIHNKTIAHIARIAGAPKDAASGLFLHKKLGEKIKRGEALYTIHTASPDRLKYAMESATSSSGYTIR